MIRSLIAQAVAGLFAPLDEYEVIYDGGFPVVLPPAEPAGSLVDTGLVVRYFFDEAASGTTPTEVVDRSGNNFNLTTINYGAGNMAYVEISGQRGLESTALTGTQRASADISDTTDVVRDALDDTQQFTIEVVLRLDQGNDSGGRIFGINANDGENGSMVLKANNSSAGFITLAINQEDVLVFTLGDSNRHVIHVVVDSTQATQNDRVRYSLDGGTLTQVTNSVILNQLTPLSLGSDLIALNRESSGDFDRSIDGVLFYAALYSAALTQQEIVNNYDILSVNDDQ